MQVKPFVVDIPVSAITDLHLRLDLTRWPERLMGSSASMGSGAPMSLQASTTRLRNRPSNSTASSVWKSSPYHQYQSEPSAP